MKKYFLMAIVAMAVCVMSSCSKDSKYEEVNEETQSYWTYQDLAGVWIDVTDKDDPMAPFVQVKGYGFYSEGFIAEGQIRSGDVAYAFGHSRVVLFLRNGYEEAYQIEWLNEGHTMCVWQRVVYVKSQYVALPGWTPRTMIKVAAVPKGWTE